MLLSCEIVYVVAFIADILGLGTSMKEKSKIIPFVILVVVFAVILIYGVVGTIASLTQGADTSTLTRSIMRLFLGFLVGALTLGYRLVLNRRKSSQETADLAPVEMRQGKIWLILGIVYMVIPLTVIGLHAWEVLNGRTFDPLTILLVFMFAIPGVIMLLFYFRWHIIVHHDRLDYRPMLGPRKVCYFVELGRVELSSIQPDPEMNIALYTKMGKRLLKTNVRRRGFWVLVERIAPYVENPGYLPIRQPAESVLPPDNLPAPGVYPPALDYSLPNYPPSSYSPSSGYPPPSYPPSKINPLQ